MEYGIISCIPIAVLIAGVLITKRMPEMLLLASVVGAVLVYKENFFSGYIEMIYLALSTSALQFLLVLLALFGGMIKLLEKSGALLGFSDIIARFANTKKKAMVCTWLMGIIMFIDDYLNVLAVSFSMRDITDRNGIPREHLAYAVNSMGACVCVLVPFSSWSAFAMGVCKEQGLGFADYIRAIPYMFFPLFAVIVCLLVAVGVIPKVGPIRKAYARIAAGGSVLVEEKEGSASLINFDSGDSEEDAPSPSSPWNFIIPILLLVAVMIYTQDLIHGVIVAIVAQAVLYLSQKIMNLTKFGEAFFQGVTSMASLSFVICTAYVLSIANDKMGFSGFLIGELSDLIIPSTLPAIAFVSISFVAFAAGSFWILIVITAPVFLPLAVNMGIDPAVVLAAIMSGVAFGSKFCFYSDAVFMTSAGTGVSNLTQIRAVAPYVLGSAALAAGLFLIAGFAMV